MKKFIIRKENKPSIINMIKDFLCLLKLDTPYEIIIRPYKNNRSNDQNALYWKWLEIIGKELGYTRDEMHELCRYKFLGMHSKEIAGVKIEYLPSTTKLKVGEMSEYLESISRWTAELGIRLPAMEES